MRRFRVVVTFLLLIGCQEEAPQVRQARELYDQLRDFGLGHGQGAPPKVLAFDCDSRDAQQGPCIDVHISEPTEDRVAKGCDCAAIGRLLTTVTACCDGTPGSGRATCENGTSWYVDCRGDPNNFFKLRGQAPNQPEFGVSFPTGFTRGLWPCQVGGARNKDLEMLERVHAACCKS